MELLLIGSVVIIMIATWLDVKRKQESGEYDDMMELKLDP